MNLNFFTFFYICFFLFYFSFRSKNMHSSLSPQPLKCVLSSFDILNNFAKIWLTLKQLALHLSSQPLNSLNVVSIKFKKRVSELSHNLLPPTLSQMRRQIQNVCKTDAPNLAEPHFFRVAKGLLTFSSRQEQLLSVIDDLEEAVIK